MSLYDNTHMHISKNIRDIQILYVRVPRLMGVLWAEYY